MKYFRGILGNLPQKTGGPDIHVLYSGLKLYILESNSKKSFLYILLMTMYMLFTTICFYWVYFFLLKGSNNFGS